MSNELLASKIVITEEEPAVRGIQPVATAVLGVVGVTERGPFTRTRVTSPSEYQNIFGGYTALGKVKQALDGFFANGGTQAYVQRTVHFTDVSSKATKTSAAATLNLQTAASAPFAGAVTSSNTPTYDLEPADTVIVNTDAIGNETATFDAAAASVTSANAETYALIDGDSMNFTTQDGVQTVTFNTAEFVAIGAATALEVAAVINAEASGIFADGSSGSVVITTDRRGTSASIGTFADASGTPVATLGFTGLSDAGTGDVANIDAVTFAEVKAVLEADITNSSGITVTQEPGLTVTITSNTTGAGSSIAVDATSTADAIIGWDNATHSGGTGAAQNTLQVDAKTDGAYGNDLRILVAAATSGDADEFNLQVEEDGVIVETFPNLSMTDTDDNFAETVINNAATGSNLIAVTDLDAVAPSPSDIPASGTFGPLAGGADGLGAIDDNDFIGAEAGETGFRGFDDVQDLTLLICPDRPTAAVQNAMVTYAEVTRSMSMFAILDPPASLDADGIVTYVNTTAALGGATEFAAIYWPQVKILNPNKTVFGTADTLVMPPSGHIAGVYARTDASQPGGVYLPPAGIEEGRLLSIVGFETDEVLKEAKRDIVFPQRINPLTTFPGAPRFIDGARTLKGGGNFPSVSERRGVIFIEQSIKGGLQFARHKNNTPELRAAVDRTVTGFLLIQMNNGAFRTRDPNTAFFSDFSDALNPDSIVFAGQMIGRIGLATNKPTEFLILKFSQDTRALEEETAA
jgi:phage tail sheath protein FI